MFEASFLSGIAASLLIALLVELINFISMGNSDRKKIIYYSMELYREAKAQVLFSQIQMDKKNITADMFDEFFIKKFPSTCYLLLKADADIYICKKKVREIKQYFSYIQNIFHDKSINRLNEYRYSFLPPLKKSPKSSEQLAQEILSEFNILLCKVNDIIKKYANDENWGKAIKEMDKYA